MQSGETIHEIVKGTNKENKELQKTELSLIYQASHQPDKEWPIHKYIKSSREMC